jgi:hypothetical protein
LNNEVEMLFIEKLLYLKGPKREIFVAGIFAQIRPIWIELGPKIQKNYVWGLKFHL